MSLPRFVPGAALLAAILALPAALAPLAASAQATQPARPGPAADIFAAVERNDFATARRLAAAAGDPLTLRVVDWLDYRRPDTFASFRALAAFLDASPGWPDAGTMTRLAEKAAAVDGTVTPEALRAWFERRPPRTGDGALAYFRALDMQGALAGREKALGEAWVALDFEADVEKAFLARFGRHLSARDHVARLDRLLWTDRVTAARRMLPLVDRDQARLAEARLALSARAPGIDGIVAKVPAALADHPGLAYDRMRWRRQAGNDAAAAEILLDTRFDHRPYGERWAAEARLLARRALERGDAVQAVRLAAAHKTERGVAFAEAEFLAGWVSLVRLKDAEAAYGHFDRLYRGVEYPISLSRGAFWAGRAAGARGDAALAERWYAVAAQYPATFYGQRAHEQLGRTLPMLVSAEAPAAALQAFGGDERVRAARLLARHGQTAALRAMLGTLAASAGDADTRLLVAGLARELGRAREAVEVAKRADREDGMFAAAGWPVWPVAAPRGPAIRVAPQPTLVQALIRQESAFDHEAVSRSNALGLMQLLPSTAKHVAGELGLDFSQARLTADPDYNVTLGTHYLGGLLDRFGGSAPLALAAYNAGPSRVVRWLADNGDPRNGQVDLVDWIESIPFDETRNYVQRVLEAVPVYERLLEGGGHGAFVRPPS